MATLTMDLPDDIVKRLKAKAQSNGKTVEDLLREGVYEVLADHPDRVTHISRQIITEEADLLRRLA
jgi:plasmid stability protein